LSSRVEADGDWHVADRSYAGSADVSSDSRFDAESRDPTAWTPSAAYDEPPRQLTFAEAARALKAGAAEAWEERRSGGKGARSDEEKRREEEQEKEGTRQFGYVWYGVAFVLWYVMSGTKKKRDDGEGTGGGGGGGGGGGATKSPRPMRRSNPRVVDGNGGDRGGRASLSGDAAEAAGAPSDASGVDSFVRKMGLEKYFPSGFAKREERTSVRTDPKTGRLVATTVSKTSRGDGSSVITETVRDHATGKPLSRRVLRSVPARGANGANGAGGGSESGEAPVEPSAAPRAAARARPQAPSAEARATPGSKRVAGNAFNNDDAAKAKREARRLKRLAARKVSVFIYRYILHESCSQFDSLPLTSLLSRRTP
jgi:hypothetical protein